MFFSSLYSATYVLRASRISSWHGGVIEPVVLPNYQAWQRRETLAAGSKELGMSEYFALRLLVVALIADLKRSGVRVAWFLVARHTNMNHAMRGIV